MSTTFQTIVRLRSEETGGEVALVENLVPPGWGGPPLHHHAFDEAFYVLAGRLTFQLGDELATAGPGTVVFAPGGSVHTLANLGHEPARYLLLCTPAGFERYFDRIAAEAAGAAPPSSAAGPVPETIVVGPQLDERDDLHRGRELAPAGGPVTVHVRGAESAGRMALMENVARPGFGPALHHHGFDELFVVLDGEVTFQLGDERLIRRAGEHAFAPRGVHHTFANLSGADARMLIVCTPAGFEGYFARIAARIEGVDPPEWALAPTPAVITVGPPIGGEVR